MRSRRLYFDAGDPARVGTRRLSEELVSVLAAQGWTFARCSVTTQGWLVRSPRWRVTCTRGETVLVLVVNQRRQLVGPQIAIRDPSNPHRLVSSAEVEAVVRDGYVVSSSTPQSWVPRSRILK